MGGLLQPKVAFVDAVRDVAEDLDAVPVYLHGLVILDDLELRDE
jgi:hypothetical protein